MQISPERLALTQELEALLADYWYDVDTNWGRNAHLYYAEDSRFIGMKHTYEGRDQIRAFYKWRKDRGERTVVHMITNFRALPEGEDQATCNWVLQLYAADGTPVRPMSHPIQVTQMSDRLRCVPGEGWLITERRFEDMFVGGIPATNPDLSAR